MDGVIGNTGDRTRSMTIPASFISDSNRACWSKRAGAGGVVIVVDGVVIDAGGDGFNTKLRLLKQSCMC